MLSEDIWNLVADHDVCHDGKRKQMQDETKIEKAPILTVKHKSIVT